MPQHDLVVIGAGPGGYVAAIRAAQLGLNVAVIEQESALGGTCLRVGCIPSKALLESSELFTEARQSFGRHGIVLASVELDLKAMLRRKEQIVNGLTKGVESLFKKNKITRYLGHGKVMSANSVTVESKEGAVGLSAKNILIATGSKPSSLPGIQMDRDRVVTSTEALWPTARRSAVRSSSAGPTASKWHRRRSGLMPEPGSIVGNRAAPAGRASPPQPGRKERRQDARQHLRRRDRAVYLAPSFDGAGPGGETAPRDQGEGVVPHDDS